MTAVKQFRYRSTSIARSAPGILRLLTAQRKEHATDRAGPGRVDDRMACHHSDAGQPRRVEGKQGDGTEGDVCSVHADTDLLTTIDKGFGQNDRLYTLAPFIYSSPSLSSGDLH